MFIVLNWHLCVFDIKDLISAAGGTEPVLRICWPNFENITLQQIKYESGRSDNSAENCDEHKGDVSHARQLQVSATSSNLNNDRVLGSHKCSKKDEPWGKKRAFCWRKKKGFWPPSISGCTTKSPQKLPDTPQLLGLRAEWLMGSLCTSAGLHRSMDCMCTFRFLLQGFPS